MLSFFIRNKMPPVALPAFELRNSARARGLTSAESQTHQCSSMTWCIRVFMVVA